MPQHRLADMTWEELRDVDHTRAVAILPVGAVEAHGPHLPLSTDVIIAEAMARACAGELDGAGYIALVLPPIWYTEAGLAEAFPGTVSVSGSASGSWRWRTPTWTRATCEALRKAAAEAPPECTIVRVDLTRREAAQRLTKEFQSGACHAGRYEGSVVLAEEPELVRGAIAEDA